jgi:hypothetical protein
MTCIGVSCLIDKSIGRTYAVNTCSVGFSAGVEEPAPIFEDICVIANGMEVLNKIGA